MQDPLLVPEDLVVPVAVRLAWGHGPPELDGHPQVGDDDDGQWDNVLEDNDDDAVHLEHGQRQGLGVQGLRGPHQVCVMVAAPPHAAKRL